MYVPDYELLARDLRFDIDTVQPMNRAAVPARLLRFLLETALRIVDFDVGQYLRTNPDVASAFRRNDVTGTWEHFVRFGYFEGRSGQGVAFDKTWYPRKNPDVAKSVRQGKWRFGLAHDEARGAWEWRAPNAGAEADLAQWRDLLAVSTPSRTESAE
ncbi:conserved protein of unknown function [Rhodovastum atsumiense]|uniref:Uncharacterized protein n=1 Tax=Rhodovastum atsumiense TaxID=504468 RepID=A0A5M6IQU0_9PROT|nr:hypothetical protein [Rhodovastum atsumiense]KAA5610654.1 hypothetical protein F1189_17925 [Rhodovastum atsumiense]CAH2603365.1 conserved protein of unknown function [Rhodovastum atsumiense]